MLAVPMSMRLMAGLLLLSGCAGTRMVSGSLGSHSAVMPPPRSIAIIVDDGSPVPARQKKIEKHRADVRQAEAALSRDLAALLPKRGLAVVSGPGGGPPPDLILHCRLTDIRGGSAAARLLVGFGAGKAVMAVDTALMPGSAARQGTEQGPILAFSTSSTTGGMPGPGMGAATAVNSAGTAVHLIGPALGTAGTFRQGLDQEAQQTAAQIDTQLAAYFAAQHWPYPRPDASPAFWQHLKP